jgi:Zn-dependent protease/predicted transcriptional regulator
VPGSSSPPQRARWSWTIGRIAGIDIQVHATFLLLLAWVAWAEYQSVGTATAAVQGIIFMLAVFGSVVLHELGHALTAEHYGVRTRAILLLPIGGVAQLEQIPDEPSQELAIALAGPAVTVVIALILYVILRVTGAPLDWHDALSGGGTFLTRLFWINVVLAAFNLLPAFPMDGGRVLRAAIAMRTDHGTATAIAARIGQMFALAFGLVGLFVIGDLWLVLIAFFIWLAAASEASASRLKTALDGIPVSRVMITDVRTLSSRDALSAAVEHVVAGFQHDFPVVDDGKVVGVLTRADLLRALSEGRAGATVGDIMQREFAAASPNEMLNAALTRLQQCRCQTLPVMRDGQLAGMLTMESIGELVAFDSAVRGNRTRAFTNTSSTHAT